ncbi:WD40 repeat domain-containing protein [candidate division KSB1 bacterium]
MKKNYLKSIFSVLTILLLLGCNTSPTTQNAHAQINLTEILPENVDKLEKLFSMKGSTAVFLKNDQIALGSAADKIIRIRDLEKNIELKSFGNDKPVYGIKSTSDGTLLVTLQFDGKLRLWDTATGSQSIIFDNGDIILQSAAFSPEGNILATGWADKKVRIWDVNSRNLINTLEGDKGWIFNIIFSTGGELMAAGEGNGGSSIMIWNTENWRKTHIFSGSQMDIHGLAFIKDNKILASGSKTLRLWSIEENRQSDELPGHNYCLFGIKASPNGLLLATTDNAGSVRLWDVITKKCLFKKDLNIETSGVAFSPDGKMLAVSSFDNIIEVYGIKQ